MFMWESTKTDHFDWAAGNMPQDYLGSRAGVARYKGILQGISAIFSSKVADAEPERAGEYSTLSSWISSFLHPV